MAISKAITTTKTSSEIKWNISLCYKVSIQVNVATTTTSTNNHNNEQLFDVNSEDLIDHSVCLFPNVNPNQLPVSSDTLSLNSCDTAGITTHNIGTYITHLQDIRNEGNISKITTTNADCTTKKRSTLLTTDSNMFTNPIVTFIHHDNNVSPQYQRGTYTIASTLKRNNDEYNLPDNVDVHTPYILHDPILLYDCSSDTIVNTHEKEIHEHPPHNMYQYHTKMTRHNTNQYDSSISTNISTNSNISVQQYDTPSEVCDNTKRYFQWDISNRLTVNIATLESPPGLGFRMHRHTSNNGYRLHHATTSSITSYTANYNTLMTPSLISITPTSIIPSPISLTFVFNTNVYCKPKQITIAQLVNKGYTTIDTTHSKYKYSSINNDTPEYIRTPSTIKLFKNEHITYCRNIEHLAWNTHRGNTISAEESDTNPVKIQENFDARHDINTNSIAIGNKYTTVTDSDASTNISKRMEDRHTTCQ